MSGLYHRCYVRLQVEDKSDGAEDTSHHHGHGGTGTATSREADGQAIAALNNAVQKRIVLGRGLFTHTITVVPVGGGNLGIDLGLGGDLGNVSRDRSKRRDSRLGGRSSCGCACHLRNDLNEALGVAVGEVVVSCGIVVVLAQTSHRLDAPVEVGGVFGLSTFVLGRGSTLVQKSAVLGVVVTGITSVDVVQLLLSLAAVLGVAVGTRWQLLLAKESQVGGVRRVCKHTAGDVLCVNFGHGHVCLSLALLNKVHAVSAGVVVGVAIGQTWRAAQLNIA